MTRQTIDVEDFRRRMAAAKLTADHVAKQAGLPTVLVQKALQGGKVRPQQRHKLLKALEALAPRPAVKADSFEAGPRAPSSRGHAQQQPVRPSDRLPDELVPPRTPLYRISWGVTHVLIAVVLSLAIGGPLGAIIPGSEALKKLPTAVLLVLALLAPTMPSVREKYRPWVRWLLYILVTGALYLYAVSYYVRSHRVPLLRRCLFGGGLAVPALVFLVWAVNNQRSAWANYRDKTQAAFDKGHEEAIALLGQMNDAVRDCVLSAAEGPLAHEQLQRLLKRLAFVDSKPNSTTPRMIELRGVKNLLASIDTATANPGSIFSIDAAGAAQQFLATPTAQSPVCYVLCARICLLNAQDDKNASDSSYALQAATDAEALVDPWVVSLFSISGDEAALVEGRLRAAIENSKGIARGNRATLMAAKVRDFRDLSSADCDALSNELNAACDAFRAAQTLAEANALGYQADRAKNNRADARLLLVELHIRGAMPFLHLAGEAKICAVEIAQRGAPYVLDKMRADVLDAYATTQRSEMLITLAQIEGLRALSVATVSGNAADGVQAALLRGLSFIDIGTLPRGSVEFLFQPSLHHLQPYLDLNTDIKAGFSALRESRRIR
jgi:hypothetical protein